MTTENCINIEPKHLLLLKKILKQTVPDKIIWAYGSRVTGTSHIKSDLDIAVFKADEKQIYELKDALEESDLPFSVDVMDWEKIPESFKESIQLKYVEITNDL